MDARGGAAYGFYNDTLLLTGWGVLEVRAGYGDTGQDDETTCFLAGYLEGFLTARQMFSHYSNMYPQLIKDEKVVHALKRFLSKQDAWSREQVKLKGNSDTLWRHMGLILAQLDGLLSSLDDFYLLGSGLLVTQTTNGVFNDAWSREQVKLKGNSDTLWRHMGLILAQLDGLQAGAAYWAKTQQIEPLSLFTVQFINGIGDLLDLVPALTARSNSSAPGTGPWFTYAASMRIYKHWDLRLSGAHTATGKMSFSSYPGTYNSQYMVLDLNKVSLGRSIDDGALTVVEQIPGKVLYSDQTQALRRGYWPSYNVPFHADIYNLSGYGVMRQRYGEEFSYDLCPRAKILRRDQARVSGLSSLKHMMRYNNYKRDPYTKGHPCKTICCRDDLKLRRARPVQVTDYHMARRLGAEVINGPTTQGGLRPFSWQRFNATAHRDLPLTYNFTDVKSHMVDRCRPHGPIENYNSHLVCASARSGGGGGALARGAV
ncbi:LOW QUALITY PROTEIN: hypothetical protein CRUP_032567 [Coryphaenoides rupestris]|nr:LOW QUALITY PROTEIN: hypothetical protein CRUP_032567 [Coryphaenoides rupestris]